MALRSTPLLARMSLYISCYEDMRYVIDRGVRSPRVDRVAIKQGRFAVDFRINALVCSLTRASETSSHAMPHVFVTTYV